MRKGKESRVEERKGEERKDTRARARGFPSEDEVKAFFVSIGDTEFAAHIWYSYYKAIGWRTTDGKRITAENWREIVRERELLDP